jgi:hypothetical protein
MKRSVSNIPLPFFACFAIGLLCSNISSAQAELEMDEYIQEFFMGETVFPQEKKELQFTLMPVFIKSEFDQFSIPLAVEYGITDRLQAEIEVPYLMSAISERRSVHGIGNTAVGVLYNIVKRNRPFSLSVGVEKSFETSGKQIHAYGTETSWEAFTVVGRQFGSTQLHANLASEFSEGEIVMNYGVASVFNFGRCSATFEVNSNKDEKRTYHLAPGLILSRPNGFEFGMAIMKSIRSAYGDWGFVAMATYEFSL